MKFVSLFAGVGGFDLGLDHAGWECVGQVEWDERCQQVLRYHWPDVPKWGDVSTVNGADLPTADAITFGSPCQDLSVAGRRAGLDGNRSGLFYEAIRIIEEMQDATVGALPRFAIWENVGGALSSNGGDDFRAVVAAFADLGAVDISWRVLDARWFGVAQRRRRVFVVADFAGECAGAIHAEPEGVRWDSCPRPTPGPVAAGGAGGGAGSGVAATLNSGGNNGGFRTEPGEHLVVVPQYFALQPDDRLGGPGALRANSVEVSPGLTATELAASTDRGLRIVEPVPYVKVIRSGARSADGSLPAEVWREEPVAPTLNAMDNGGESRATVAIATLTSRCGSTQDDQQTMQLVPSATRVRRLTPTECERLMGWPDDHTKFGVTAGGMTVELPDSVRYRQCGNGVVANVAWWIARQLDAAVEAEQ